MYKIMRIPEKGKVATPQSMNASFNGNPFKIDFSWGYSICAAIDETSASLVGTLHLQASNNAFQDNVQNEVRSDAVWVDIPNTSAVLDGGDDQVFWNVSDANYEAVRIVWTRTSGQGTMSTYILAKGEG